MSKILKEFRFVDKVNDNEAVLIIINNDKTSICIVDKEVVYRLANKIVYNSNNDITIYVYDPQISKKTLFPIQWYFIDYEAELEDMDQFDRQSIVEGNKDLP